MQTVQTKTRKVGNYVSTQHVDTVIRNYKQERWVHNSERIGKEDSLSAWWSIEEMEDFIATAKMHGADGLKFYFAAYSEDYKEIPEYAERQTLVMVGTKESETQTGIRNKDIYVQTENGVNILAYGQASMCPPRCKPTDPLDPSSGSYDQEGIGVTVIDRGEKGIYIL